MTKSNHPELIRQRVGSQDFDPLNYSSSAAIRQDLPEDLNFKGRRSLRKDATFQRTSKRSGSKEEGTKVPSGTEGGEEWARE